jgi:hypothetical protein
MKILIVVLSIMFTTNINAANAEIKILFHTKAIYQTFDDVPKNDWYSLVYYKDKTILEKVKLVLWNKRDKELGGSSISYKNYKRNCNRDSLIVPIIMVNGLENINKLKPKSIYINIPECIESSDTTIEVRLNGQQVKIAIQKEENHKTIIIEKNNKKQEIHCENLWWVGDINNDNEIDLITYENKTDCLFGPVLYLGIKETNTIVEKVAYYANPCD